MYQIRRMMVIFAVCAIFFVIATPSTHAQMRSSNCENSKAISFNNIMSSQSQAATCYNFFDYLFDYSIDVTITVLRGEINLFYTQDITATLNWRGDYGTNDDTFTTTFQLDRDLPHNSPTLMVLPSSGVSFQIEFKVVQGDLTERPERTSNGPIVIMPSATTHVIQLESIGDRTQLFVDVCPGEFQVMVQGMPERNDVYIHIQPLELSPPDIGDPPNVRRASHIDQHYFVSWQEISERQAEVSPVWVVYVTRNGYDRNKSLNIAVEIRDFCGSETLEDARPPRNSFRTRPKSGDKIVEGGVSVQNSCNPNGRVARSVDNQYWVCFNPVTLGYNTLEPADFDKMCRQQRHKNAYAVKPQSGAGGLECWR